MKIEIDGGLEIDVATTEEMASGFREVKKAIDKQGRLYTYRTIARSVVAQGSASKDFVAFGRPRDGMIWEAAYLTVMGSSATATVAGIAPVFCVGNPDAYTLDQVVDPGMMAGVAIQIPNTSYWGRDVLIIETQENAYVRFEGASANQQLTAILRVREYFLDNHAIRSV